MAYNLPEAATLMIVTVYAIINTIMSQHGRPQEFLQRGKTAWIDKNDTVFDVQRARTKHFAIFWRFRLNLWLFYANA